MLIAKNIYSNTDKFIKGNKTKFSYSGKLYEENSSNTMFFCYAYSKPKKNQTDNIKKKEMKNSVLGYQTEITLRDLGNMYFAFELEDKKDNNMGHWYKIEIEEMPIALLVLKQKTLPQKLSRFDYFKDQCRNTFSRAFDAFTKLKALTGLSKDEQTNNL